MIYLGFRTLAQIRITGGDLLLEHREHVGIHVDYLGVSSSDAALAHVVLAAGHEAGQLQVGVRGSISVITFLKLWKADTSAYTFNNCLNVITGQHLPSGVDDHDGLDVALVLVFGFSSSATSRAQPLASCTPPRGVYLSQNQDYLLRD